MADSELEMNYGLAKLNYAATFCSAGVRIRDVVGGNYEAQRGRGIRRMNSITGSLGSHLVQPPSRECNIRSGGINTQLAAEIAAAQGSDWTHDI